MKKFFTFLSIIFLLANHGFSQCTTSVSRAQLDINNISASINNAGTLWLSTDTIHPAYQAPKGGDVGVLSSGGLWIGGLDPGGALHMAAATYRQNGNDYIVGPINYSGSYNFDTVWVMYKSTIDSFNAGLFSAIPHSIKYWPAQGNPNLPDLPNQSLAPFVDVNGNGIYDPSKGDYPAIKGDEATWEVFNDGCSPHTETAGSLPLDIEVHLMAYAFDSSDCLNNTTFYQYEIISESSVAYDSTYIGIFADPDLGCYEDDYTGCIPALNMGVGYNGEDTDGPCTPNYGAHPPLLGIQMVNLPLNQNGDTVHMSDFTYYNNDFTVIGNPVGASEYYGYLTGTWKDGTHFTYGGNGHGGPSNYNYMFPSDPTDTSTDAWSECHDSTLGPDVFGDRRFIMSFGPIKLQPGSVTSYTFDVLFFDTTGIIYPCPSFSYLTDMAQCVKESNVTGINTPTSQNNFVNFYPNPMGDAGTFAFKINSVKEIKLFNILGQQVRDYTTINGTTQPLQRGNLSSGIYFYSVIMNNGKVGNGKIIVQ
jgi:hypothetical protein